MSALTAERSRNKRRFLGVVLVVGALTLHYDIVASPVVRAIPELVWELLYLAAVAAPLLVTSRKWLVNAGVAIILAAAVSRVYFDYASASMWCLFAAALSLYLCFVFHEAHEQRACLSAASEPCR